MFQPVILAWVLGVCSALRRSQAKTLAELVAAAVPTERVGLANMGRAMGTAARCEHRIKRATRFVANRQAAVADGMAGVIARLTEPWWCRSSGWGCGRSTHHGDESAFVSVKSGRKS